MRTTIAANVLRDRRDRRRGKTPSSETRTLVVRGLLACVMFAALLGGAWVAGTQETLIGWRNASVERKTDPYRVGWIIYEKADGLTCTYAPFDTATERIGESSDALCEGVARKWKASNQGDFAWGQNR